MIIIISIISFMCVRMDTLVLVQVPAVQVPLEANFGAEVITGCRLSCAISQIPVLEEQ